MSGYTSIWLEDFKADQHAVYGDHHFTRDAVLAFARQYDPQGFHLNDEAAAKTHFKRLSASGWHTAAACMKHLAAYHFKLRGEAAGLHQPAVAPAGLPGRYDHVFRYHNRRTGDEVASRLGPDHTDAAGP